jgi:hypothetical protein
MLAAREEEWIAATLPMILLGWFREHIGALRAATHGRMLRVNEP